MILETEIWLSGVFVATGGVGMGGLLLLGPLRVQSKEICVYL